MTKKPAPKKSVQKPKVRDLAPKVSPTGGVMTKKPVFSGKTGGVICTGCASQGDCMS